MKLIEKFKVKLEEDKHFKELVKGSGTAFALRVLGIIFGYLFTFTVSRKLGAKAWGIFALSMVLLQVASVIGKLGMDTALLRFVPEYLAKKNIKTLKEIYKKIIFLILPFSLIISLAVYLLSPLISAKVFHKPYLAKSFQLIALAIVPFVFLGIHREAIRGLKKIKEYMFFQQLGVSLFALCFFLGFVSFYNKEIVPIISYDLSILVLSVMVFILWRRYLDNLERFGLKETDISMPPSSGGIIKYSAILSVSIPMFFSNSLGMLMGWTDTIMLGMLRTTQEVGVYNVALRISTITSISLVAINTIAAPKFAEFWGKKDMEGLGKIARQSTKLIFWMSFPILVIVIIFSKQILSIFGQEFKIGVIALVILTIGQFVNAFVGSVGNILQMTGYEGFHQKVVLIGTVLNIILNYFLIPYYGINGAAVASAISMIFWNVTMVLFVNSRFNFWTFAFIFSFFKNKGE